MKVHCLWQHLKVIPILLLDIWVVVRHDVAGKAGQVVSYIRWQVMKTRLSLLVDYRVRTRRVSEEHSLLRALYPLRVHIPISRVLALPPAFLLFVLRLRSGR